MRMKVVESVADGFHCVTHGTIQNIVDLMQVIIHLNLVEIHHHHPQTRQTQPQQQLQLLTKRNKIRRVRPHPMVRIHNRNEQVDVLGRKKNNNNFLIRNRFQPSARRWSLGFARSPAGK